LNNREASVTFTGVNANLITDRLSVRFTAINGQDAQAAARANNISILTDGDYLKMMVPTNLRAVPAGSGKMTLSWE
jgi:hypothetical protein